MSNMLDASTNTLKAYRAWPYEDGWIDDGFMLIYATSRNCAKVLAFRDGMWPETPYYEIRARRIQSCDKYAGQSPAICRDKDLPQEFLGGSDP